MKAVLIFGGIISDYDYIKSYINNNDFIICADSGYAHAVKMGLGADLIIGDFDSLDLSVANLTPPEVTVCLPVRKNLTDSEAALLEARKAGYKDILILGALGARMDHSLNNVMMLNNCLKNGENAVIVDEYNEIRITESRIKINGKKGDLLSLVPICDCTGVTTENLEYPLLGAKLTLGESLGVSNVMTADNATISVECGTILIITSREERMRQ